MGLDPALVVVNGLRPDRFTAAEAQRLAADDVRDHPAVHAALAAHDQAREQRAQLARLRRRVDAPTATLPYQAGEVDVAALAARLGQAIA
jgi:hypothetical protein